VVVPDSAPVPTGPVGRRLFFFAIGAVAAFRMRVSSSAQPDT
jgi:hypothetical protein